MSNIVNTSFMVKDLLQGDESVTLREDYNEIEPTEVQRAINIILNNKDLKESEKMVIMNNLWMPVYKIRPPTPEEFLTSEWIGPTSLTVRPWVRDVFLSVFNPNNNYEDIILNQAIRSGKSYATALITLYSNVVLNLMRNPKRFLNQSPATVICSLFVSFGQEKVIELLVEPMTNIIENSEKFFKCKTLDQLDRKIKSNENKIFWTTAGDTNIMTIGKHGNVKIASSASKLLGLAILTGGLTELSFFKERGYSDSKIMNLYNSLKGRVHTSFPGCFLARTILDTSPNDASNNTTIDWWIRNEAYKNKKNLICTGPQWQYVPSNYKEWQNTGKTFPVFIGDNSNPPKILDEMEDSLNYNKTDIIDVPIDVKSLFEDDLSKSLKDLAGIPSGDRDKILSDPSKISRIFDNNLLNNYLYNLVYEDQNPDDALWPAIRDKFFIRVGTDKYQFYRLPDVKRSFSIDQGLTRDSLCLAISHDEFTSDGRVMYVTDLILTLIPNKKRINLDAPVSLIEKMYKLGGMKFVAGSFDGYQSETNIQRLRRVGIEMHLLSVDFPADAYLFFVSLINSGLYKCGRNIFLKNSFKSLKFSKTEGGKLKIDHEKGHVSNVEGLSDDWENSPYGLFSKDASDAVCGSIELLRRFKTSLPTEVWKDYTKENKKNDITVTLSNLGFKVR